MSTPSLVPIFSPDGQLGDIPAEHLPNAVKAGGVPGVHILDPQGNPGVIPANRMQDAFKAGAKMVPFSAQPIQHEGTWKAILGDIGGLAKSLPGSIVQHIAPETDLLPQSIRDRVGLPPTLDQQSQQMAADYQRRKTEGYSAPYRVAAPVAEAVGANVTGMEQAAQKGDVGGVIGHAAVPVAMAASVPVMQGAGRVANRVIPSTTRAGVGLGMLTDSPEGAFAQHPVETPNALATARKIRNELEITGEKPHPIVQNYLAGEDLRNMPPEIAAQGIAPSPPMTMYEARTTLKRVNDIIRNSKGFAQDAATKTATTNLKRFANALDQDISVGAQQAGFGKDYEAMRNEYRQGKAIVRGADALGGTVGALVGYETGRAFGEPLGGAYIGGKIGKGVAKYTTGAAARAVVERNAGPPRLRSLPPSPEAYTRTLLDAKEGRISPGEADRRVTRSGGSARVNPIDRSNVAPTQAPTVATPPASSAEAKVNEFIKQATMRKAQEIAGQGVLDEMEANGESPIVLNNHFWDQTFNRLPPEVQARFTDYLKKETGGMKPGDVIGTRADGSKIVAQSWGDIAKNILDLSHDPQALNGTTRGLVALMRMAEERFKQPSVNAPPLPRLAQ